MVGEMIAGIGAFKSMLDAAKAIKDINDATVRAGAIIELQGQILAAQAEQSALVDEVRTLKEKIAQFETWETEKQRYKLYDLGWNTLAYMLKPEARGTEIPHWVCTKCYGDRRISIIHFTTPKGFHCPTCRTDMRPEQSKPKWLD